MGRKAEVHNNGVRLSEIDQDVIMRILSRGALKKDKSCTVTLETLNIWAIPFYL